MRPTEEIIGIFKHVLGFFYILWAAFVFTDFYFFGADFDVLFRNETIIVLGQFRFRLFGSCPVSVPVHTFHAGSSSVRGHPA